MTKLKDLEAAYKQQARQEQAAPPVELWSRIEASLNSAQVVKKRALPFWWRMGAAAAAVAALLVTVFLLPLKDQDVHLAQENRPATKTAAEGTTARYEAPTPEERTADPGNSSAGSKSLADNSFLPQAEEGAIGATPPTRAHDQGPGAAIPSSPNQTTLPPLNHRPDRPRFAASSPDAASLKIPKNLSFERFDVPASN